MSNANDKKKMKYTTVGTVKAVVLTKDAYSFTLEPISAYRFFTKDDDEKSWKIIFKKEAVDHTELELIAQEAKFTVKNKLVDVLIALKQNKAKIEVSVESEPGMEGDEFDVLQITVK